MSRFSIILLFILSFGQMNWQFETIDSTDYYQTDLWYDYMTHDVLVDTNGEPHVVYYRANKIIHAIQTDSGWQKELGESGLIYFSLSFKCDRNNLLHLAYYRRDQDLNMTYLCYAQRNTNGWLIDVVDSIYGLSAFSLVSCFRTSLDLDTFNLPGIAYLSWNSADSFSYLKYAHFNGVYWDTSIVDYDSACANIPYSGNLSPSLKFNSKNIPYIAFRHLHGEYDTIKIAYFDDTLNKWIVNPVICWPDGGRNPVSLDLNS